MNVRLLGLLLVFPLFLQAQQIQYSDPENEDSRKTDFEIIGRVSGNYLVFKNNRSENAISVYGPDMKLIQRARLSFMPEKYINVDFVHYNDFFYLICEYQKKNTVHLAVIKMDGNCKIIGNAVDLDTSQVGSANSNKIYTILVSEDRERLMALKINTKNPKTYIFTNFLFDKDLELLDRHQITMPIQDHADMFSNFDLDNEGSLVFTRFAHSGNSEAISHISFVVKGPQSDTFAIRDIGANERILDELKVKVDNYNKRYLISAFYYNQRRGNIEGIYTVVWDKATDSKIKETVTIFSDEMRSLAKSSESNDKMAFNDYFIKSLVTKKDGGYIVISEAEFTTSRGTSYSRSDYLYSPYNSLDYYSPYYNPYSPYYHNGGQAVNRYNAENILILSFDKNSNLEWSNVIPKSQFDDEGNSQISYKSLNTGGQLHFLYNQYDKRTLLLSDQSIGPDGKVTRYPTFHSLDKGYDFLPRLGKQVASNQILIPCLYRNYLCFAKIDF